MEKQLPPTLVDVAVTLFVWCMIGLGVLWVIARLGERITKRLGPAVPVIAAAILLGGIAISWYSTTFG